MTLSIDIYSAFDDDIAQPWRYLENSSDCYIFQGYDWNAHWYRCIGSTLPQAQLCIALVRHGGTPAILFPFFSYQRFRVTCLQFIGGDQSDYLAPIFRPDIIQSLDLAYVWGRVLVLLPKHDIIILEKMPHDICGETNPFLSLWPASSFSQAYSASLPRDWNTLLSRSSSKLRSDSRRQLRRLSQHGDITFHVAKELKDYNQLISIMFSQKSARYHATGARDLLANKHLRNFYRSAFHSLGDDYVVHLSTLRCASETLATHWGVLYKQRFYWLMPSYCLGPFSVFSPGRILLEHVLRFCIDSCISTFDFTVGSEPYKMAWCDQTTVLSYHSKSRSLVGFFVLRIRALYISLKYNTRSRALLMMLVRTYRRHRSS